MGYPRIAGYFWNKGSGYPWTTAEDYGAPLNLAAIAAAARYPFITLDIAPVFDPDPVTGRPDIAAAFRRANPTIKLGIYDTFGWTYLRPDFGDLPDWARRKKLKVLRDTNGIDLSNGVIRWEQPPTEAGMTGLYLDLWCAHRGDFFFLDFCYTNTTAGTRAMQRCIHALKQAGCPVVIGNSEVLDKPPTAFNTEGCMQEGFAANTFPIDPKNIGLWRSGRPHKTHDWLQGGRGIADPTTPAAQRACRFMHGVACLNGMLGSFGPDRDQTIPYHLWWNEVYDAGGRGTGWLGEPTSDIYYVNPYPVAMRRFAEGMVLVNTTAIGVTVPLPKGLCRFDGTEMGSVTVQPYDAYFLVRA